MIKAFKIIAFLEGLSLLVLFFVAMPLKYVCKMETATWYPGLFHGLLFIAYLYLAFAIRERMGWNYRQFFLVCAASCVPLGTFYIEKKYLRA